MARKKRIITLEIIREWEAKLYELGEVLNKSTIYTPDKVPDGRVLKHQYDTILNELALVGQQGQVIILKIEEKATKKIAMVILDNIEEEVARLLYNKLLKEKFDLISLINYRTGEIFFKDFPEFS